ncbi:MAG: hypothetical protein QOE80_2833, partial [Actinomycetota bacterium]|nr:hypothetical protein [Actinomycetota bacterium]
MPAPRPAPARTAATIPRAPWWPARRPPAPAPPAATNLHPPLVRRPGVRWPERCRPVRVRTAVTIRRGRAVPRRVLNRPGPVRTGATSLQGPGALRRVPLGLRKRRLVRVRRAATSLRGPAVLRPVRQGLLTRPRLARVRMAATSLRRPAVLRAGWIRPDRGARAVTTRRRREPVQGQRPGPEPEERAVRRTLPCPEPRAATRRRPAASPGRRVPSSPSPAPPGGTIRPRPTLVPRRLGSRLAERPVWV